MRWGASAAEFVRPVHWLVMLFGADVIPARILDTDAGERRAGIDSWRRRNSRSRKPADYETMLREKGKVIADFGERRARIGAQVAGRRGVAVRRRFAERFAAR